MPKKAAGLTARKVETIRKPGLHADGYGLYLQVTDGGAKSWILRYQIQGRRRDMGLGSLSMLPLADARDKARDFRREIAAGRDPIEARRAIVSAAAVAAARATTFKEAAEGYIASKRAGWSNEKHAGQWQTTLATYAYPTIGALPVSEVDTSLVLKVLEPIWSKKAETANRLRGRIEMVLDYAKVRGYRSGENPARWRGHLDHILPSREDASPRGHHAALPYSAMPDFWPRLELADGMGARALELLILTATRTSELLGADWSELDLEKALWTIPAARMKAGREHKVPLPEAALVLLRKLRAVRQGNAVLPGNSDGGRLSNMVMAQVLRRMKLDATPHGFRSTFRTWAAEETSFPSDVAEACLAHTVSDAVVAAYQRGDFFEKRRRLMAAWAAFVEGKDGGRVVAMRGRGRSA